MMVRAAVQTEFVTHYAVLKVDLEGESALGEKL